MGMGELAHSGAPCVQGNYGVQGGWWSPAVPRALCSSLRWPQNLDSALLGPLPGRILLHLGSLAADGLGQAHLMGFSGARTWDSHGIVRSFLDQLLTLLHPDLVFHSLHFKGHFSFAGCF